MNLASKHESCAAITTGSALFTAASASAADCTAASRWLVAVDICPGVGILPTRFARLNEFNASNSPCASPALSCANSADCRASSSLVKPSKHCGGLSGVVFASLAFVCASPLFVAAAADACCSCVRISVRSDMLLSPPRLGGLSFGRLFSLRLARGLARPARGARRDSQFGQRRGDQFGRRLRLAATAAAGHNFRPRARQHRARTLTCAERLLLVRQ